jgi:molecular chaperone GrpE
MSKKDTPYEDKTTDNKAANNTTVEGELLDENADVATITESEEAINNAAKDAILSAEELVQQSRIMQTEIEKLEDKLLRQQAEQQNLQRRMEREIDHARKFAVERFIKELLPIKDSMEIAQVAAAKDDADWATLRQGNDLIVKMMVAMMAKLSITEINPAIGEKFNPQWHEAMSMLPDPEKESGNIMIVHQKGYLLNERLIRAAKVIVVQ